MHGPAWQREPGAVGGEEPAVAGGGRQRGRGDVDAQYPAAGADLGPVRPAPGLTRLVPVTWMVPGAEVADGHRAAFLEGAAVADAPAAIPPDRASGDPVPLLVVPGRRPPPG
ncbi:hypothetical protein ACWEPM_32585 [Streptomyces sp. NPDC004244]